MSFFSEDDQRARRGNQVKGPSDEEKRAFSHNWAREKLAETLATIKDAYRRDAGGASFSYDRTPFTGSKSRLDPRLDYEMGVKELVRLVEAAGVPCTIKPGNGYTKSGFSVSF